MELNLFASMDTLCCGQTKKKKEKKFIVEKQKEKRKKQIVLQKLTSKRPGMGGEEKKNYSCAQGKLRLTQLTFSLIKCYALVLVVFLTCVWLFAFCWKILAMSPF